MLQPRISRKISLTLKRWGVGGGICMEKDWSGRCETAARTIAEVMPKSPEQTQCCSGTCCHSWTTDSCPWKFHSVDYQNGVSIAFAGLSH